MVVGATVLERDDVVDLGRWSDPAVLLAVSTHRVCGDVVVADLASCTVVASIDSRVTLVW